MIEAVEMVVVALSTGAPVNHRGQLVKALLGAGVESEIELIEAAEKVGLLVGGSVVLTLSGVGRDSTEVQIGDNPVMHLKVER